MSVISRTRSASMGRPPALLEIVRLLDLYWLTHNERPTLTSS